MDQGDVAAHTAGGSPSATLPQPTRFVPAMPDAASDHQDVVKEATNEAESKAMSGQLHPISSNGADLADGGLAGPDSRQASSMRCTDTDGLPQGQAAPSQLSATTSQAEPASDGSLPLPHDMPVAETSAMSDLPVLAEQQGECWTVPMPVLHTPGSCQAS